MALHRPGKHWQVLSSCVAVVGPLLLCDSMIAAPSCGQFRFQSLLVTENISVGRLPFRSCIFPQKESKYETLQHESVSVGQAFVEGSCLLIVPRHIDCIAMLHTIQGVYATGPTGVIYMYGRAKFGSTVLYLTA